MKWNILSPIHVLSKDFIWFICVFYIFNLDFHTKKNKNADFKTLQNLPYSASYPISLIASPVVSNLMIIASNNIYLFIDKKSTQNHIWESM